MTVAKDKVVSFHYTLTGEDGEVIDTSLETEPLAYLHGANNIIPGLERELEGQEVGAELDVVVQPEDGYGTRQQELVLTVQRSEFEGGPELEPGLQFQAETPQGLQVFTIVDIDGDNILIDGNHPLADQVLKFAVKITDIRDASEDELAHGHVHGPGGHHH